MRLRSIALPTPEEVLRELPELLTASGELTPRPLTGAQDGKLWELSVRASLSPAFANPDLERDLGAFPDLERAFLERQIERTQRDYHREPSGDYDGTPSPWVLTELSIAPLVTDMSDREDGTGILFLEVPLFTIDRQRAVLRGQRHGSEDFEHWLQKTEGRWTST